MYSARSGGLDVHQLLNRLHIAQVVGHGRDIVQPVGEGDILQEGVALADLLVVAVQVAHHRLQVHDRLAVQRYHDAQHAVRRRVLRAQVDHDLVGLEANVFHFRRGRQPGIQRLVALRRPILQREAIRIFDVVPKGLCCSARYTWPPGQRDSNGLLLFFEVRLLPVLAHGVAPKALPHQDALEVGMAGEADPVQVPGFALLEVGAGEHRHQRRQHRVVARGLGLKHHPRPARNAIEMIDHLHLAFFQVVHGRGRREIVVAFVAQPGGHFQQVLGLDQVAAVVLAWVGRGHPRELFVELGLVWEPALWQRSC